MLRHKFALWQEATRTPLMWVVPGVTKPGTLCGRPVDFMSIYPTLCDVVGIAKPEWLAGAAAAWNTPAVTTHGRNNRAVWSERWRYIRYADGSEEH